MCNIHPYFPQPSETIKEFLENFQCKFSESHQCVHIIIIHKSTASANFTHFVWICSREGTKVNVRKIWNKISAAIIFNEWSVTIIWKIAIWRESLLEFLNCKRISSCCCCCCCSLRFCFLDKQMKLKQYNNGIAHHDLPLIVISLLFDSFFFASPYYWTAADYVQLCIEFKKPSNREKRFSLENTLYIMLY